jgi:hypothetical protein
VVAALGVTTAEFYGAEQELDATSESPDDESPRSAAAG